jgi:ribosomal protein L29
MKTRIATTLIAFLVSAGAAAEIKQTTLTRSEIAHEIDVSDWSLKHSSVSASISKNVLDNSMQSLQRAREELDNGNLRTAREWIRRASQPLAQMNNTTGKHPDPVAYKLEIRDTLQSLLPVAEQIAAEKSASTAFIADARQDIARSDTLLQERRLDAAHEVLEEAYLRVQKHIADLRHGDTFYLPAPRTASAADWLDGLNRVEERRNISRYLLIEVQAEGNDLRTLESGLQMAEATVADATRYASEKQWGRALEKLDLAYAQYETSWRAAGVDW